jgi:UDP-N-acetylglucosamine 4-epimerase
MKSKLYSVPYHSVDISQHKFLVTGGAGFIGSNIVEYLLNFGAGHVRVLDNLANGYLENIDEFESHSNFDFIEGDIRDLVTCQRAVKDMDFITHQAALGSVPRSIKDPITSNAVNISGFLNMMVAAKESDSLKRMIYAASSSTYGDS